ncbi:MAG: FG-GAP-like repeat-containing protein, partial [Syntrophales bacterium]
SSMIITTTADVTLTGEGSNNFFGWSVSKAGDINNDMSADYIIGAPGYSNNQGKAYIYLGGKNPSSIAATQITGTANSKAGYSVSYGGKLDGDNYGDVVIGMPGSGAGAARVYYGTATGALIEKTEITGEVASDWFGASVQGTGDIQKNGKGNVIVGAPQYDVANKPNSGRAYLFYASSFAAKPTTISATAANLQFTGTHTDERFALSLAALGDFNNDTYPDFGIGAMWNGAYTAKGGAVYIYYGGATPNNVADTIIYADTRGEWFSTSIDGTGDMNGDDITEIIVGAPYNSGTATNAGRVNLYNLSFFKSIDAYPNQVKHAYPGTNVQFTITLKNNIGAGMVNIENTSTYNWNTNVSESGTPLINNGGDSIPDAAFTGTGTKTLVVNATVPLNAAPNTKNIITITASNETTPTANDIVTLTIIVDENTVLPTAPIAVEGSAINTYLTGIAPGSWSSYWWMSNGGANTLKAIGDFNGDGYTDMVVGAPSADSQGYTDNGMVYLYLGGSNAPSGTPYNFYGPTESDAYFGYAISGGDINGDGFDDIAISAPARNAYGTDSGMVYVFYGTSSPSHRYATTADLTITPIAYYREDNNDYYYTFQYGTFGYSIAADGDVNGDGYKDILVGAPLAVWDYTNTVPRPYGFVYLYYGGPTPDNNMDYSIRGEAYYTQFPNYASMLLDAYYGYGGRFGSDVALADVNGDSLADMIVGAPTMKGVAGTELQAGRTYVFYGSSSLTAITYPNLQYNKGIIYAGTATGVVFASNEAYSRFGSAIAKGSINGDIYADILIGTPYTDISSSVDVGSVFMWHGQNFPTGASVIPSTNANIRVNGTAAYSLFGFSVAGIGDLNSDNFG